MHRRSRSGCFTCRLRRKKCDESRPVCRACKHLNVDCEYKRPTWWQHPDRRKQHKEVIKEKIRITKLQEKPSQKQREEQQKHRQQQQQLQQVAKHHQMPLGINTPPSLCHSQPTTDAHSEMMPHTRAGSVDSHFSPRLEMDTPGGFFNSTPLMPPPQWTPMTGQYATFPPYEVDVKTERQMYVNEVPTQKDSVVSTFTTLQPQSAESSLPSAPIDGWVDQEFLEGHNDLLKEEQLDFNFFEFPHAPFSPTHEAVISVEECDKYLLDHFLENVSRLIFPIMDANQHGSARADVILPALESNKCYLHTCLSTAALHLKATGQMQGEQIDNDIMRHRFATISELCGAFERDNESSQNLEATLGLIMFQSSVGAPEDGLPDIPWHQHFQAAKTLIEQLDLHNQAKSNETQQHVSFNITLASWIDILGATMLGRIPAFAPYYREKIEADQTSGLAELMGCEDRIMYLISEISALEFLKSEGRLDSLQLCSHIAALGEQLTVTEQKGELCNVYSSTGAIRPKQLSKNITALFRTAARIHLCSLVPDFDRFHSNIKGLVDSFAEIWEMIPSGPDGFDRSLVWPILITGSVAVEGSYFRRVFSGRHAWLGDLASLGSFGRVSEVLQNVWNINDETASSGEKQSVHWRDVMVYKGWESLLI